MQRETKRHSYGSQADKIGAQAPPGGIAGIGGTRPTATDELALRMLAAVVDEANRQCPSRVITPRIRRVSATSGVGVEPEENNGSPDIHARRSGVGRATSDLVRWRL